MRFQDRYYGGDNWSPRRHGPSRSGRGFADWEVWKKLVAINIAVFVLQILITRPATEGDLRRLPYFDPDHYAEYDEDSYTYYVEQDEENTRPEDVDAESRKAPNDKTNTEDSEDKATGEESDGASSTTDDSIEQETEKESRTRRDPTPLEVRNQVREQMFAFLPRVSILQEWCELDGDKVRQGQVWRLITAGFCHNRLSIWHLAINMLFLFWFGARLEQVYGSAEFTAFYFTALLLASLAYLALDLYTHSNIPAIGASGAVWGVATLYALMYPYERIWIYFLFPIEIRWLVLLYFLFDLHPVLLALGGDNLFTGVGHAAHIGGAVFGFIYWKEGWRLMPFITRLLRR